MPTSQASLLAVWGGVLGETPVASGARSGGSTLLQFAELRRAAVLHMRACVRSVSVAPEVELHAWSSGNRTLRLAFVIQPRLLEKDRRRTKYDT